MNPETAGEEEDDPADEPSINDPGNEDPGSLMDDALVPLIDDPDKTADEVDDSR